MSESLEFEESSGNALPKNILMSSKYKPAPTRIIQQNYD